eukprot:gnl/Spiro4/12789_TR6773_c0_g1_i1.p1 gnl/Spiro4/12789_TR6773_c0_g1~~gnl/Spiro4/12789_TR6773_c0_g1_i1.p1  ORF type:complete len:497 (+),score=89.33 gnl/Spiro4/12789_TR6773_c0_g1_i1:31-1491(+)
MGGKSSTASGECNHDCQCVGCKHVAHFDGPLLMWIVNGPTGRWCPCGVKQWVFLPHHKSCPKKNPSHRVYNRNLPTNCTCGVCNQDFLCTACNKLSHFDGYNLMKIINSPAPIGTRCPNCNGEGHWVYVADNNRCPLWPSDDAEAGTHTRAPFSASGTTTTAAHPHSAAASQFANCEILYAPDITAQFRAASGGSTNSSSTSTVHTAPVASMGVAAVGATHSTPVVAPHTPAPSTQTQSIASSPVPLNTAAIFSSSTLHSSSASSARTSSAPTTTATNSTAPAPAAAASLLSPSSSSPSTAASGSAGGQPTFLHSARSEAREQARRAIALANDKYVEHFNAGDVEKVLDLYAPTAVVVPPPMAGDGAEPPLLRGPELREFVQAFISMGVAPLTLVTHSVEWSAETATAVERGRYVHRAGSGTYAVSWQQAPPGAPVPWWIVSDEISAPDSVSTTLSAPAVSPSTPAASAPASTPAPAPAPASASSS